MKSQQVLNVYDREYAQTYDDRFLHAKHARVAFEKEIEVVRSLLTSGGRWLDVACGTGSLLSRFPDVKRSGLDLSPAMLEQARKANPDSEFHEGDFLLPRPEWEGRFDLVTCMWYAYGLVETISDIERLIANMARWTSEDGICFVPVWDPRNLSKSIRIPYLHKDRFYGGDVQIAGVVWNWVEDSGKTHEYMISPHLDHMAGIFRAAFRNVDVITYPLSNRWFGPKRKAIRASKKRKR